MTEECSNNATRAAKMPKENIFYTHVCIYVCTYKHIFWIYADYQLSVDQDLYVPISTYIH